MLKFLKMYYSFFTKGEAVAGVSKIDDKHTGKFAQLKKFIHSPKYIKIHEKQLRRNILSQVHLGCVERQLTLGTVFLLISSQIFYCIIVIFTR